MSLTPGVADDSITAGRRSGAGAPGGGGTVLWAAGTASLLAFPLTKSDAVGLSEGLVGPSRGRDEPACLGCRPSPALG